ncbi:MAG: hypothetical protein AB1668_03875 [Nanoarchaeota archaeon]
MANKRKAGKRKVKKLKVQAKPYLKKTAASSVGVKVGVAAALLAVLIFIGLMYKFAAVGKVIEMPSPAVDLTAKDSESLELSKFNKMEMKVKPSAGSVYELVLNVTKAGKEGEEIWYYELSNWTDYKTKEKEVLALGILGSYNSNSGEIYLDNDYIGDLVLSLDGSKLSVANLNFVAPQAAEIEAFNKVDKVYKKIDIDILYSELNKETVYYFNATSTSKPAVTALLDNAPVKLTETASGKDFVFSSFSLKSSTDKPQQLVLRADVSGKIAEKKFIVANNNVIYRLDGAQIPAVSLSKQVVDNQEKYALAYVFKKTQELQPFALLCGNMNVDDPAIKASVEQIVSYDEGIEQWTSNAPSDLKAIFAGRGYFFKLKKDAQLGFSIFCDDLPKANLPQMKSGWNLLGVGGYKPTSIDELKAEPGKKIVQIQEYYGSDEIKELTPGKVYWVKVE